MKAFYDQRVRAGALSLLFACAGCASSGTAVGELKEPTGEKEVTLLWKSEALNPQRGSISGKLPDGTHYSGRYFEVVKAAAEDVYGPAWDGWDPYWSGWYPSWYGGPVDDLDWPGFVTIYTGRVIANLKSDDDKSRLRCRFTIADPNAGLKGGGVGQCQLSNGQAISDVVLASDRG
ncbi:MAG: hypothetical protein WDO74_25535 [Pseudomonadota bacterium]